MQNRLLQRERSVAKFIVPDWGDKVNSGIGLSYRTARPVRQPCAGVNYIPPVKDYEFSYSALCRMETSILPLLMLIAGLKTAQEYVFQRPRWFLGYCTYLELAPPTVSLPYKKKRRLRGH